MRQVEPLSINLDATIEDAIRKIEEGGLQIALVVDQSKLIATVTDGDIRRAILSGAKLTESIARFANSNFSVVDSADSKSSVLSRMRQQNIHQMPVLNSDGELVGIYVLDDLVGTVRQDVDVVIMAGGQGMRLRPLTESCPKPLLKVGDKPILQIIIESLVKQGFTSVHISVNYLKEMIMEYFGDGSRFGIEINYLIETEPLGTAGALSLIESPKESTLVMNGDVLTRIDLVGLLNSHEAGQSPCTVCVRNYTVDIPFGVIGVENGLVNSIQEKPSMDYFVNTGIYVLNSSALELIPADQRLDMTSLMDKIIESDQQVAVFPVHEYWLDVGMHKEFAQANQDVQKLFKQ